MKNCCYRLLFIQLFLLVMVTSAFAADTKTSVPAELKVDGTTSTVVIVRGEKRYLVDIDAGSVRQLDADATTTPATSSTSGSASQDAATQPPQASPADAKLTYYVPGDVRLITVPTPMTLPKGGMRVDFTHRFPYGPAFSGKALGHTLLGLDGFALPSFGFSYGVANRIELGIYRSPSIIGRPIEMRAAFKLLSEKDGQPLNLTGRFSVDGQNDFTRNFTTNFELVGSRSIGTHAQFYLVPTLSIHNRPVLQLSGPLTAAPFRQPCSVDLAIGVPAARNVKTCANTFSMGIGLAVDVRPTVALLAEVTPTMVNGPEMGIHRPPYAFGIQKKIWRHAFTFGFTTAPGTTVAQRIATRAIFLSKPDNDKPSGLFIGFNLSRQLR